MSNKRVTTRGRLFCLVLYPENDNHRRLIQLLKQKYNILGIYHDRDIYDEDNEETGAKKGDIKKLHCHIMVEFENARYLNALAKELDIEPNLIQKVQSFEGMTKYFTHQDYPLKAQYQRSELFGTLIDKAMKCIDKTSPDLQICEIIEYLQKQKYLIPFPQFITWLCSNGYYSTQHANYALVKDLYYWYQGGYLSRENKEYKK